MAENKETPQQNEIPQEEIPLQASYVLVYLKNQLRDVRNKKPIRGLSLDTVSKIFDSSFNEVNLNASFSIGNSSYIAGKHEYHDYLEISLTKFPDENTSNVVSEGFRIKIKRGKLASDNLIEYHKKSLDDKNSEKLKNTKVAVSKAMDFISSIS